MFIAIGIYGWGRGRSGAAAIRNMNNNVSREHRNKYVLFEVDDANARVDFMGRIIAIKEPREIERKDWPEPKADPQTDGGKLGPMSAAGEVYPTEMTEANAGTGDVGRRTAVEFGLEDEEDGEGHDQLAEDRATYDREIAQSLRRRS